MTVKALQIQLIVCSEEFGFVEMCIQSVEAITYIAH